MVKAEELSPTLISCPITTSDTALLWINEHQGSVSYFSHLCTVIVNGMEGSWKVGFGGFDARGALLQAARECWLRLQKVKA